MKSKRNIFISLLIIGNIFIDQLTKSLTRKYVEPGSVSDIIGEYFTLHNVENTGAFLGMGSELSPTLKIILLLILPVVVLLVVTWQLFKDNQLDRLSVIGLSCIIGGGLANIYDRILYGSVTDFFHIDLGGVFKTGIFNVADMSVMFGMGCLLLSNFKKKPKLDTISE